MIEFILRFFSTPNKELMKNLEAWNKYKTNTNKER